MDFKEQQRGTAIYLWHFKNNLSWYRKVLSAKDTDSLHQAWTDIAIDESLENAMEQGNHAEFQYHRRGSILLCPGDQGYPSQLYDMHAPPIISVRGDTSCLRKHQVAVVGSRMTTGNARQITPIVSEEILSRGYIITSGGAAGIDALAHRHAIACNQPTIVVSAIGTNKIYPRENRDIFEYAYKNGAVVSQFPDRPLNHAPNFPQRNDVIAALSAAVIIVQCGEKSGALYTAQAARRLGRPVYAVAMPGFDDKTAGGLSLIRSGHAQMLYNDADFDAILPCAQRTIPFGCQQTKTSADEIPPATQPLSETQSRILSLVKAQTGMTRMKLRSSLSQADDFDVAILELELAGIIAVRGGVYTTNYM